MPEARWSAAALVLVPMLLAATTPNLVGRFSGTYLFDGTMTAQSMQIEVEKQHHRRFKVSVFAMNEPEFQGHGRVSKDGASFTASTKATGRHAPHLLLSGTISAGGTALDGSFTSHRAHHPDTTGTFTVAQ
jgi:hypothetical protein